MKRAALAIVVVILAIGALAAPALAIALLIYADSGVTRQVLRKGGGIPPAPGTDR